MPDGTVELIAEGQQQDISDFVAEVKTTMQSFISSSSESFSPSNRKFASFHIVL